MKRRSKLSIALFALCEILKPVEPVTLGEKNNDKIDLDVAVKYNAFAADANHDGPDTTGVGAAGTMTDNGAVTGARKTIGGVAAGAVTGT